MRYYTNSTSTNKVFFQIGPNKYWGFYDNGVETYSADKAQVVLNGDNVSVLENGIDISEKYLKEIEFLKAIQNELALSMLIKAIKKNMRK